MAIQTRFHPVELTICTQCQSPERLYTPQGWVCELCRSPDSEKICFGNQTLQDAWQKAVQDSRDYQYEQALEAIAGLGPDYTAHDTDVLCASLPIPIAQDVRAKLDEIQIAADEEDTLTRLGYEW